MNILVINGSPKGERSNTLRLTEAFLEGIGSAMEHDPPSIERLHISKLNIGSCLGCFSCWQKTPGKCCLHDDMEAVIEKLLWADLTIWSFPLYYFSLPGKLKMLMDRQLPMSLPFMVSDAKGGGHSLRYDMSEKKTVLISTCGFYSAQSNYDSVTAQFDRLRGKGNYTTLFCGEGELFRVPGLKNRTDEYLAIVRQAGREYASGRIGEETRARLGELLFPRDVFERMADASWGVTQDEDDSSLTFTRQMVALYNPASYKGTDILLDMDYTDIGKRYRIILGKSGSRVTEDLTGKPTTVIHTPLSVWQAIAGGEMEGSDALMRHLYSVEGDFDLLLKWDDYFGVEQGETVQGKGNPTDGKPSENKTNMLCMLLPWMVFWILPSINFYYGSLISLAVCVFLPLLLFKTKKTVYDVISGAAVGGFSISLLLEASILNVIPLSYLTFGAMWIVSVFFKIPITAAYSMNNYGGEAAFRNPLFVQTNRIITAAWGVLYLLTAVWTYFIMRTALWVYIRAINFLLPVLMGVFTAWFQKWYPKKFAQGSSKKETGHE